ncbi:MAG: hypothetical protein RBJ76_13120 [Stenomitos frigidus ULC029]
MIEEDCYEFTHENQQAFIGIEPLDGKVKISVHYEVTLALADIDPLLEAVRELVEEQVGHSPEDGDFVLLDAIMAGCIGNRLDLVEVVAAAMHQIRADALNKAIGVTLTEPLDNQDR